MASVDDFNALDIRAGTITASESFPEAVKPAYQLWIDFGEELGRKKSSAQLTDLYTKEELIGKQVLAVVNFPSRRIAGFRSEVLVLVLYSEDGVILIQPDKPINNGSKLG
ncbi:tRNA-binding protein [Sinobaca sp. H24]|uniref:tRNA-binding protein n=1 Tax=Sinobaca sp. H24 TaxID=2923376 RepID=UPI00207A99F4|nr:tRNA-binding protein [Sinobaca sp. H24]